MTRPPLFPFGLLVPSLALLLGCGRIHYQTSEGVTDGGAGMDAGPSADGEMRGDGGADDGRVDAGPCLDDSTTPIVSYDLRSSPDGEEVPDSASASPQVSLSVVGSVAFGDSGATFDRNGRLTAEPAAAQELARVLDALEGYTVVVWLERTVDWRIAWPEGYAVLMKDADRSAFIRVEQDLTGGNDRLTVGLGTSGTGTKFYPLNTPFQGAVTVDSSMRGRTFMNGELASWGAVEAFDPPTTVLSLGNGPDGEHPWAGLLVRVDFYPRAMTDSEIACLYAKGPRGEP